MFLTIRVRDDVIKTLDTDIVFSVKSPRERPFNKLAEKRSFTLAEDEK